MNSEQLTSSFYSQKLLIVLLSSKFPFSFSSNILHLRKQTPLPPKSINKSGKSDTAKYINPPFHPQDTESFTFIISYNLLSSKTECSKILNLLLSPSSVSVLFTSFADKS